MDDVVFYTGETAILRISIVDSVGAPVNLLGYDIRWELQSFPPLVKTQNDGQIEGNVFIVTLTPQETESLLPRGLSTIRYLYEMKVKSLGDASVSLVLRGCLRINRSHITVAEMSNSQES